MQRPQIDIILKDLKKKMVLLVGPRQAGKTTLAKQVATNYQKPLYLNYDQIKDRELLLQQAWLPDTDLLILDELHKMPDWKNYLKGLYDTRPKNQHILVTGSARLDIYDKIGDSLAGRYFRHRLMPLSLAELTKAGQTADIQKLLLRSGFPEPFFENTDIDAARWRSQYINSILSTDIFDVENVQNIKAFRLLFDLLRYCVGSPVSYQSLSEDIGVSPATVKKYIEILAAVYVIFIVTPYSQHIARSLLKEPKIYFFDAALVEGGDGAKLENLVAISLLKDIYAQEDELAQDLSLHYLRTKDGQEVDFAIARNHSVEKMIEVKRSDGTVSKHLLKFSQRYHFKSIQLVQYLDHEYVFQDTAVLDASHYLKSLYL